MQIPVISGGKSCFQSSSLIPGLGDEDSFTNGNFLYRCKFPLQKRNLFPAFM